MESSIKAEPLMYSQETIQALQVELGRSSLMGRSLAKQKQSVDVFMKMAIDVPGHGEAGGYEHNRHKQNYHYMYVAGSLFLVTEEAKYRDFIVALLDEYAEKYLTFDFHVQKNTNPTGRLFHQILNEHCWLLFTSLAYSCVKHTLSEAQKTKYEQQIFEPMLSMFTDKYAHDFDRIHNHGIWAVAAVGICGLALGQRDYLEMSVYGLERNGSGGFLAQISELFSPSGYYMEGPYYHRYAIHPLCLFAEVLHLWMPELKIYEYKQGVVGNTVKALLASAYPSGVFPPLNDASRTMGVTDAGVQVAVAVYAKHYPFDANVVRIAHLQDQVWLHGPGLSLSHQHEAALEQGEIGAPYWPSIELTEGRHGDAGAVGILRKQVTSDDISQLTMNYGQHGMGHGHFDTLGITFFSRNQEVLQDYGFVRWVNVEPKFGGRYLAENVSYARHTIAHNGVTVDQKSQNNFDVTRADSVHGVKHFFDATDPNCLAVSAFANEHYDDVGLHRSCFLLTLPQIQAPVLVDVYRLSSDTHHTYDYSHQYEGQLVRTNFTVAQEEALKPWGHSQGYQHLWKRSHGEVTGTALISWLQNNTYYTWLGTSSQPKGELVFTTVGASDPSFNLKHTTGFTLRCEGESTVFASALETHGYFNEEFEQSTEARGQLRAIQVIGHNEQATVVCVKGVESKVTIAIANASDVTANTRNAVVFDGHRYEWEGFYQVMSSDVLEEEKV